MASEGARVTETPATSGGRLRLAGQARGVAQRQLAGMAGVSRQAVSAVEAGHSDPSLRVAFALSQALGMTVEELFGPGDVAQPVAAVPVAAPDAATGLGFIPAGGRAVPAGAATGPGPAPGTVSV